MLPRGAAVLTLDEVRLPAELLTNHSRYLDRLNFATNFVFFRDEDGLSTRLVSANYWAGYGAGPMRLWLRLYGADGTTLATWEQKLTAGPGGFAIDSREVRARFDLARSMMRVTPNCCCGFMPRWSIRCCCAMISLLGRSRWPSSRCCRTTCASSSTP